MAVYHPVVVVGVSILLHVVRSSLAKPLQAIVSGVSLVAGLKKAGLLGLKIFMGTSMAYLLGKSPWLLESSSSADLSDYPWPPQSDGGNYRDYEGYRSDNSSSRQPASPDFLDFDNAPTSASVGKTASNFSGRVGRTRDGLERFFRWLSRADDNLCISRLLCEIAGALKLEGGRGSQNLKKLLGVIQELPEDSAAHRYQMVLQFGMDHGAKSCEGAFLMCTSSRYTLVRSLAKRFTLLPETGDSA